MGTRSGEAPGEGQECACNCKADKKSSVVVLRGGLSDVPTHHLKCSGAGKKFVRSHNAVAQQLHDAVRAAKLYGRKEPRDWIDGQRTFGAGANGEPNEQPDLLIQLGYEAAVGVEVLLALGTTLSELAWHVRHPPAPLGRQERARRGQ